MVCDGKVTFILLHNGIPFDQKSIPRRHPAEKYGPITPHRSLYSLA